MDENKQIRSIKLAKDLGSVEIMFVILNANESDEEKPKPYRYKVDGPCRPHKDLIDCMKKLRKHAFAINEMTVDSKEVGDWIVAEVKIDGDYLLEQSRVSMKLRKKVERTGKFCKMDVGQTTMHPTDDDNVKYHGAKEMTVIIEDLIEECWSYLSGKTDEEGQLPLFPGIQTLKVA